VRSSNINGGAKYFSSLFNANLGDRKVCRPKGVRETGARRSRSIARSHEIFREDGRARDPRVHAVAPARRHGADRARRRAVAASEEHPRGAAAAAVLECKCQQPSEVAHLSWRAARAMDNSRLVQGGAAASNRHRRVTAGRRRRQRRRRRRQRDGGRVAHSR
jgi:hypothetical protein